MRQRMLAVRMLTAATGIVRLANITTIMAIRLISTRTVSVPMSMMTRLAQLQDLHHPQALRLEPFSLLKTNLLILVLKL